MLNIYKIAKELIKTRYIERSPSLSKQELSELLEIITKESGKNTWRLVQHKNVEANETWYELDLQEDWFENTYEELEWLNYTR
jgi:hypothetical protein